MYYKNFVNSIESFGPYESNPVMVVGVSGGIDSLALVFLAKDWLHSINGKVIALTVNHNLRKEAFDEAVERLPKGAFYASVNIHHQWIGNYLQIFHMTEEKMEENSLYFIYGLKGKFWITKIETEMNSQSIEESVRHTVKKNYDFFQKHEREQFEEIYTAYNLEEDL